MQCVLQITGRCGMMLLIVALTTSAYQTIEDTSVVNMWRPVPLQRLETKQGAANRTLGTSLQPEKSVGEPTLVEGTGRFVGDPRSTPQQSAGDHSEDGVTLNLVNVPAPQAATSGRYQVSDYFE